MGARGRARLGAILSFNTVASPPRSRDAQRRLPWALEARPIRNVPVRSIGTACVSGRTGLGLCAGGSSAAVGSACSHYGSISRIFGVFRSIPGPEDALAGHPLTLVTVILVRIVITMWAVWWGAGKAPTVDQRAKTCHRRNASRSWIRRTLRREAPASLEPCPPPRESGGNRVNNRVSRTLTGGTCVLPAGLQDWYSAVMLFSIINFVFNDHFPFRTVLKRVRPWISP
jgi:hypothetical protein